MKVLVYHEEGREIRNFVIGLAVTVILLCLAYLAMPYIFCPFNKMTGLSCPFCGIGHAFLEMLKGNVIGAIKYHPAIAFCALYAGLILFNSGLQGIFKRKLVCSFSSKEKKTVFAIAILTLGINWFQKLAF